MEHPAQRDSQPQRGSDLEHPAQRYPQPQPDTEERLGTPRTALPTTAAGHRGATWNTPHSATHNRSGGATWNTPHSATHNRSRTQRSDLEHPAQRYPQPQPDTEVRLGTARVLGPWGEVVPAWCRRSQVVVSDITGFCGPVALTMRLHAQVVSRPNRPIRPRLACGAGFELACFDIAAPGTELKPTLHEAIACIRTTPSRGLLILGARHLQPANGVPQPQVGCDADRAEPRECGEQDGYGTDKGGVSCHRPQQQTDQPQHPGEPIDAVADNAVVRPARLADNSPQPLDRRQ